MSETNTEWEPSDADFCGNCARFKHTTLEGIGPTTTRTCLDCQKIPPAYRDRRTSRQATEDEYKRIKAAGVTLAVTPFGLSVPHEQNAVDKITGRPPERPLPLNTATITGVTQNVLELLFYAIDGAQALCDDTPENTIRYVSAKKDLDRLIEFYKTLGGHQDSLKYGQAAKNRAAKLSESKLSAPKTAPKTVRAKKT